MVRGPTYAQKNIGSKKITTTFCLEFSGLIWDCAQTTWTSEGRGGLIYFTLQELFRKSIRREEEVTNAPNSVYVVCTQPLLVPHAMLGA